MIVFHLDEKYDNTAPAPVLYGTVLYRTVHIMHLILFCDSCFQSGLVRYRTIPGTVRYRIV